MHDDRIQGILFAHSSLINLGQPVVHKGVIERVLAATGLGTIRGNHSKLITHVTVQFVAGDQYITDPGALLGRFRAPEELYGSPSDRQE
jgi:hypothetical protein